MGWDTACGPFVENRLAIYQLHNLAKTYGGRPSAWLGLADQVGEWFAYQFDLLCLTIGRKADNALEENAARVNSDRRPAEYVLRKALDLPVEDLYSAPQGTLKIAKLKPGESEIEALLRLENHDG